MSRSIMKTGVSDVCDRILNQKNSAIFIRFVPGYLLTPVVFHYIDGLLLNLKKKKKK